MRIVALAIAIFAMAHLAAAAPDAPPDYQAMIADLAHKPGLITLYQDEAAGKAYFSFPKSANDDGVLGRYIYVNALTAGLGSNPVGLDRGNGSAPALVVLRLMNGQLIVEAQNTAFRASATRAAEQKSVHDSFARSILWSGPVTATSKDGRVLVDMTGFLVRDASLVAIQLKDAKQGGFTLDMARSTLDTRASLAFPDNLEFDAVLTFASTDPGPEVRATAAVPQSVTLVQHHSFIKLPGDGYRTRRSDPRAATIPVTYADYSAPLSAPLEVRLARRFRLEKINPGAAPSKVKKPIVYYVDNGAPEPVRSALMDGIGWWAKAFEAAGYIDAFQVKVLPKGVHPLDARYNVVQWVHRHTRGWSYGGGIADPRTGEMIKAMVTLGSLRVRQDRLIFEGLLGAQKTGSGDVDDPVELALARIRQLGAHEVGHTLGFLHNMAASTYGDRASVMDYPAPEVTANDDGTLDVSRAYGVGVGAWDLFTARYLYSEAPKGEDENAYLEKLVRDGYAHDLRYVADRHARPAGAGHPFGNLWDTGTDPVASLANVMKVRAIGLSRFGLDNLQNGQRLSDLQAALVPLYLYHRYQVEAATKPIGGFDFVYGMKGDGSPTAKMLSPAYQRAALTEVLKTVDPAALDIPDRVLALLTPRVEGENYSKEMFKPASNPAFDVAGAAQVSARITFSHLLHPARAARLIEFYRRDAANPSLDEVLTITTNTVFNSPKGESARLHILRQGVQVQLVDALIALARDAQSSAAVKARTEQHLRDLSGRLSRRYKPVDKAIWAMLAGTINRYLDRTEAPAKASAARLETPPGSPIGMNAGGWEDMCWLCQP